MASRACRRSYVDRPTFTLGISARRLDLAVISCGGSRSELQTATETAGRLCWSAIADFSCDAAEDPLLLPDTTTVRRWKTLRNTTAVKKVFFCTPAVIELDGDASDWSGQRLRWALTILRTARKFGVCATAKGIPWFRDPCLPMGCCLSPGLRTPNGD